MSEIKTKFPPVRIPSRFPVAPQGKPDTLSSEPAMEAITHKYEKSEVQFEHPAKGMSDCDDCKHFDPCWSCYLVNGMVRPEDWCNKFEQIKGIGYSIPSSAIKGLAYSGEEDDKVQ